MPANFLRTLCLVSFASLLAFASVAEANTRNRTIHRELRKGGPDRIVKIRNLFSRTRHVAIVRLPHRAVARADLIAVRGDPAVRIRPIGAVPNRRVARSSIVVRGQKWNFNTKRWQNFRLLIKIAVSMPYKPPRREPVATVDRRTTVAPGRTRHGTIRNMVKAPVRKLAMMAGSGNVRVSLRHGVLRVTGVRPGRAIVVVGGERWNRRVNKWQRFRVRLSVTVARP